MRRNMIWTLMLVFVLLITGCAQKETATPAPGATDKPVSEATSVSEPTSKPDVGHDPVTIVYWSVEYAPWQEAQDKFEASFMEEYPWITIEREVISGAEYLTKVLIANAGEALPDVLYADGSWSANLGEAEVLFPLDDFATEEWLDGIEPRILSATEYKEHRYLLPLMESTQILYFNKPLLEEEGIEVPTSYDEAWTWDEFTDAAKRLTKDLDGDGVIDQYGIGWAQQGSNFMYELLPFIHSNGGLLVSTDGLEIDGYANSPETLEAIEMFAKIWTEDESAPFDMVPNAFLDGKVAMQISTDGAMHVWDPDIAGTSPLPYIKERKTGCGHWHIGIASTTEHPEEAWLWIDWLIGPDKNSVMFYDEHNALPIRLDELTEAYPDLLEDPSMSLAIEQNRMSCSPRPAYTPAYSVLNDEFNAAINGIRGGADISSTMEDVVTIVDRELAKFR